MLQNSLSVFPARRRKIHFLCFTSFDKVDVPARPALNVSSLTIANANKMFKLQFASVLCMEKKGKANKMIEMFIKNF